MPDQSKPNAVGATRLAGWYAVIGPRGHIVAAARREDEAWSIADWWEGADGSAKRAGYTLHRSHIIVEDEPHG